MPDQKSYENEINMRRTYHRNKEVEAVVNSWPLTYIYEEEVEEVLTPSHL